MPLPELQLYSTIYAMELEKKTVFAVCMAPEIFETRSLKIKKYTFLRVKNDFLQFWGFQLCSGEHLSNNGMKQGIKGRELRGAHTAQHYTQFWPDKIFAFPMSSTAQSESEYF